MTRSCILTRCVVPRARQTLCFLWHHRAASSAVVAAAAAAETRAMTPAAGDLPAATPSPILPRSFHWLYQHCPAFPISGSKVRVIVDPREFYQELLDKAGAARERISISSLYLGTGKLEEKLVSVVGQRVAAVDGLKVHWLLDHTRGSRGHHSSRSMLRPLLAQYPHSCSVSLYHTPHLRGLLRRLIPQRWNETIGLQHMKLYVFDDSLLISGANLSNDYFTNRQDRYMAFEDCPALAAFYHNLIATVSRFCPQLATDDSTSMPAGTSVHPYLGDLEEYCGTMREAVLRLWRAECDRNPERLRHMESTGDTSASSSSSSLDTLVFPTLQMGPFGITNDGYVTKRFLSSAEEGSHIHLASGYFNLTEEYMKCVLGQSRASYSILMAHPEANGFLGARGFAGAIPAAYTQLAKLFFRRVTSGSQEHRISLHEYRRKGWTFHAKGLWYARPGHTWPALTMVGSPNFGWRSVQRDLETQVVVVTQNTALREALHREHSRLYDCGTEVTDGTFSSPGRYVPLWVRCVMPIIKAFF
ncbi:CDP-diacylglycerol--glycerol-3-phosphate 3-phosphatidyltransferase, mitochondrial-like isoform X1 [Scylla paramamosain]|uniref:CDP-diacylglycerol--glycerol-3-phosphate 3-phosphatidyltransferase, mitochondrial-like isoform X1 n=2 Tax=Scylla paramamosain TaxID=85552 RepID=UPI003082A838